MAKNFEPTVSTTLETLQFVAGMLHQMGNPLWGQTLPDDQFRTKNQEQCGRLSGIVAELISSLDAMKALRDFGASVSNSGATNVGSVAPNCPSDSKLEHSHMNAPDKVTRLERHIAELLEQQSSVTHEVCDLRETLDRLRSELTGAIRHRREFATKLIEANGRLCNESNKVKTLSETVDALEKERNASQRRAMKSERELRDASSKATSSPVDSTTVEPTTQTASAPEEEQPVVDLMRQVWRALDERGTNNRETCGSVFEAEQEHVFGDRRIVTRVIIRHDDAPVIEMAR